MKKYKIGVLSDSPLICTGYSNQSTQIANILSAAGHDVIFFAHAYTGQMLVPPIKFEDGKTLNFKIIGGGREPYFKDLLQVYIKQFNLDVLFILLDTFMLFGNDGWFLKMDLSPAKVIFYYPSDGGGGIPRDCQNILAKVDKPIAMAKYGQIQVKDMYGIDSGYIPHAIETDVFYPFSAEEKLKLKQRWGLQDKFVIGTVARNQGRKMMDRTLKSFAKYAREDPHAILFMHTDPDDVAQVFSMIEMIKRYNLQNRIVFSGMTWFKGFDYSRMNEIYNLMDVFLLTTSGEGFGIPIIEAMSCKIPCLVTDYTTTQELVLDHKAGLGIDLVGTELEENPRVHEKEILDGTLTGSWDVERGICSIKDTVKKLKWFKEHIKEREEMGENGRKAVLKYYDWKVTGPKWINLIEELGGQY